MHQEPSGSPWAQKTLCRTAPPRSADWDAGEGRGTRWRDPQSRGAGDELAGSIQVSAGAQVGAFPAWEGQDGGTGRGVRAADHCRVPTAQEEDLAVSKADRLETTEARKGFTHVAADSLGNVPARPLCVHSVCLRHGSARGEALRNQRAICPSTYPPPPPTGGLQKKPREQRMTT